MYGFLILNIEKAHTTVLESLNTNSNLEGSFWFSFLFLHLLRCYRRWHTLSTATQNITARLLQECMGLFHGLNCNILAKTTPYCKRTGLTVWKNECQEPIPLGIPDDPLNQIQVGWHSVSSLQQREISRRHVHEKSGPCTKAQIIFEVRYIHAWNSWDHVKRTWRYECAFTPAESRVIEADVNQHPRPLGLHSKTLSHTALAPLLRM